MRIAAPPGVFTPRSDSWLLARLVGDRARPGMRALDPFCGSGILAIAAALQGAATTAVDISRRAVWATRMNAVRNRVRVRAVHSASLDSLGDERFDLIAANPPYLPGPVAEARGLARAWAGGDHGRNFIDELCRAAPERLTPSGSLLLIHSAICGPPATLELLRDQGLEAEVLARHRGPVGPLLAARRPELAGAIEELVVIAARRAP